MPMNTTPLRWLLCHPQQLNYSVAEFLNRDLGKVCDWCDRWGMKLNKSKTKNIIVSRSRIIHPQSPRPR